MALGATAAPAASPRRGNLDADSCLSTFRPATSAVGESLMDYLILGLIFGGWILLQHVILPRLGVPT